MELKEEAEFLKKNGYLEIDFVETISFRINKDLNEKLEQLAKIKQTTKSTLIRASLDIFILSVNKLESKDVLSANVKASTRPFSTVSIRINSSDLAKIDKISQTLNVDRSDLIRYAVYKLLEKNNVV